MSRVTFVTLISRSAIGFIRSMSSATEILRVEVPAASGREPAGQLQDRYPGIRSGITRRKGHSPGGDAAHRRRGPLMVRSLGLRLLAVDHPVDQHAEALGPEGEGGLAF